MLVQIADATARDEGTRARHVLDRGSDVGVVAEALRTLTPLDREVLVLRYRDDLSLASIARVTESTVGEVHQRLRRGALAVEEGAGGSAAVPMLRREESDDATTLEDLQLGITPQLAARVRRAVRSVDLPVVAQTHRARVRLRAEAWVRRRLPQLTTLAGIAGGAALTIASLGG